MFAELLRRKFLQHNSIGFGAMALASLQQSWGWSGDSSLPANAALKTTHLPAKVKHVIFCFMSGGVSHVDTFDPKPKLNELHGQPMPMPIERTQFNNNGSIMASPFQFARYGQSGIPVSELFPHIASQIDQLAVVRSMTTPVSEHAQGNFMMHSGFPFLGHPSAGAWCSYGLGSENENLPGYVVLQSGDAVPPHGGVGLFSNGFLPGQHQGTILKADQKQAVYNLQPSGSWRLAEAGLEFVRQLDREFAESQSQNAQLVAAIRNHEIAFKMQTEVPSLCDLSEETEATLRLYGVDSPDRLTSAYAKQCLLARRLVERGVRFIELSCLTANIGAGNAPNPWDQHGELERGHRAMALQVDQPIAALIEDLRQRSLLDRTLIVWAGEFGRTPFSQGSNGRDHNPFGFSIWLAGGGIRGGTIYGATDDFGYRVIENPCTIYDLWATVLHLLGIDHTKLTYRYSGRDFRLTDVHGHVLHELLA